MIIYLVSFFQITLFYLKKNAKMLKLFFNYFLFLLISLFSLYYLVCTEIICKKKNIQTSNIYLYMKKFFIGM